MENNSNEEEQFIFSKEGKIAAVVIGVLVLGIAVYIGWTAPTMPEGYPLPENSAIETPTHPLIRVTSIKSNTIITSPLTLTGEALGTWFFEASFPVKLLDAMGNEMAVQPAHAQADWMTENFVPFSVTLEFKPPISATGTLVFQKDNPSGLPEHDDEFLIPIRFR